MAGRLEHLLAQQGGKLRCPLGSTRGAEAAPTAAARHEVLVLTRRAPDPGEGCFEPPTVQVALDDVVYESPPEAVALLEALLPRALCLVVECLDKAIQGRLLWLACPKEADSGTLCGQGEAPSLSQRGGALPGWTNLRRGSTTLVLMPIPLHSGFDAKWTLYCALLRVGDAQSIAAAARSLATADPQSAAEMVSNAPL